MKKVMFGMFVSLIFGWMLFGAIQNAKAVPTLSYSGYFIRADWDQYNGYTGWYVTEGAKINLWSDGTVTWENAPH